MNMMHTNTAHTNLTCTNMTHTNITHTTTLSRKEQEDIRRITAQCRLTDGLSLSCPEDGDEYWLLEEDATAAAFLAVYKTEETMWECYAFTHPYFRRKGYFSAPGIPFPSRLLHAKTFHVRQAIARDRIHTPQ